MSGPLVSLNMAALADTSGPKSDLEVYLPEGARKLGGPEGIRTLDLFHAMEARSQLRHRPVRKGLTS